MNGFTYPAVENFHHKVVYNNYINDFDCISSADLSDAMGYLNIHSQAAHRINKTLGSHIDFALFLCNCPYLLYYHAWLQQIPWPTESCSTNAQPQCIEKVCFHVPSGLHCQVE